MFAEPSKLTAVAVSPVVPLILKALAVASLVAEPAFPDVLWFPAVFTPGRSILAEPLKDTPPIVLAVAKVVAVLALPVKAPIKPPVAVIVLDATIVVAPLKAPLIAAEPSKDCPHIVLAVANLVAVAAFPVVAAFFKAYTVSPYAFTLASVKNNLVPSAILVVLNVCQVLLPLQYSEVVPATIALSLVPTNVVIVVAKFGSLPKAKANSFNVSSASGAVAIKFATFISTYPFKLVYFPNDFHYKLIHFHL